MIRALIALLLSGCSSLSWNVGPYKTDADMRIAQRSWCQRERERDICAVIDQDCLDYREVCAD